MDASDAFCSEWYPVNTQRKGLERVVEEWLRNQIKCGVKHGGLCRLLQHHNENRCNWSFVRKLSISLIQHRQDFEASIRGSQRPNASLMTRQQFS
ncbi:hypothetical protein Bpfe_030017 [Biomphalaria pfeifferi]|uniref:Uncharacterized protein n=1 Tax=Biomphalaria pfeifferi TaxID=112525 RepID=A0AAD8AQI4_BIOPF|nr:hypothetical protein Bpfe_030017 [Biomphalaria pfeifferi]